MQFFLVYKPNHKQQRKRKEKEEEERIDFEWRKHTPEAESSIGYVSSAAATPATVKFSVTPPLNWPMNWSEFFSLSSLFG